MCGCRGGLGITLTRNFNNFSDTSYAIFTTHPHLKEHSWLQPSTTNCRSGFNTMVSWSTTSGQRLPQLAYQGKPNLQAWYNITIQLKNHNKAIYKRPMTPSDDFRLNTIVRILVAS
jgi:hypothetical protein